jgi:hypothetical protein
VGCREGRQLELGARGARAGGRERGTAAHATMAIRSCHGLTVSLQILSTAQMNPSLPVSAGAAAVEPSDAAAPSSDPALARSLTAHDLAERWVVVGVWLASRQLPDVPFFLQLIDDKTGRCCIDLKKPYRSRSLLNKSVLSNGIMHVRVAQRRDAQSTLFGEVRYLCDDITASYQTGRELYFELHWRIN